MNDSGKERKQDGDDQQVHGLQKRVRRPLHDACAKGETALVRKLLEAGANVDDKDRQGATPLIIACEHGARASLIRLLVQKGASINSSDTAGRTPLYAGAMALAPASLTVILDARPNVDCETNASETPLTAAVVTRRQRICKILLEHGANVNYRCRDGGTALHYAIYEKWIWGVGWLLSVGANPRGGLWGRYTLAEWAMLSQSMQIIEAVTSALLGSPPGKRDLWRALRRLGMLANKKS